MDTSAFVPPKFLPVSTVARESAHHVSRCARRPVCSASPEKRAKRIRKARDRLLEYVPHAGEFPTLAEVEAALGAALSEANGVRNPANIAMPRKPVSGVRIVEICKGKACLKKGADQFADSLQEMQVDGTPFVSVRCKCQDQCKKPGITVRVLGEDNAWRTFGVDSPEELVSWNQKAEAQPTSMVESSVPIIFRP